MFHKLSLCFLPIILFFSGPLMAIEHFEHYRNLTLASQIIQIKETVEENKEFLPSEAYDRLIYHINVSTELLNQTYD